MVTATTRISSAGRKKPLSNARGFTLFELLVVMAIMTAASAVAIPRFAAGLETISARSAVRDACDLFRRARALSILNREEWHVVVNDEEGSFALIGPSRGEEESDKTETFSLPRKLSIQKVVTFLSPPTTSKAGAAPTEIIFYPAGNCSGGWIEIVDGRNRTYAIQINPFHGRVRVIEKTVAKK